MYQYQKNDLVICKPDDSKIDDSNKNFLIYARVVDIDREADIVILDKYLKEGRLHSNPTSKNKTPSKLPLTRLENKGYYQPMTYDEVLKFRDGLMELITSPLQANSLDNADICATLQVVNEFVEKMEKS